MRAVEHKWVGRAVKYLQEMAAPTKLYIEIRRDAVNSYAIATVGYDRERGVLQVEYFNGFIFQVENFPVEKFEELMAEEDFDDAFSDIVLGSYMLTRIGRVFQLCPL